MPMLSSCNMKQIQWKYNEEVKENNSFIPRLLALWTNGDNIEYEVEYRTLSHFIRAMNH